MAEDARKVKRYSRFGGLTHDEYIKAVIEEDDRMNGKKLNPTIPKDFERWLARQVKRQSHGLPVEEYEDDSPPECPLCNGTKVYKDDAPCPHCRGKGHCWTFLE